MCFVGPFLVGFRFILESEIFLPLLTHSPASCPILRLHPIHMFQDLKIQLTLDLNGECLEQVPIFASESSCPFQFFTISDDRGERQTHLSQNVINPGLFGDIESLVCFHLSVTNGLSPNISETTLSVNSRYWQGWDGQ